MPEQQKHPFLTLLEQHSRAIDRVCRSFAKDNEMDFEDLRQETIVNLWIGWQEYQPRYKSVTWVWRIAVNTGISWQRRNLRHQQYECVAYADYAEVLPDASHLQELMELIALLPAKDQHLMKLYLDGWKLGEIAQMLATTETNIQTRIYRIKNHLKELSNE